MDDTRRRTLVWGGKAQNLQKAYYQIIIIKQM